MPIKLIKTPSQLFFMNSILFFNKVTNIFLEDSLTSDKYALALPESSFCRNVFDRFFWML